MSAMNFSGSAQTSNAPSAFLPGPVRALPQAAAGLDAMTAQAFAAPARIGAVLPAAAVSAGFATLPSIGGSASHLISAVASNVNGGVHVLTHVS